MNFIEKFKQGWKKFRQDLREFWQLINDPRFFKWLDRPESLGLKAPDTVKSKKPSE